MRRHIWTILFSLTALHAEDISGIWQGTLGEGTDKVRLMLRIAKGHDRWTGTLFSIDQGADWGSGQSFSSVIRRAKSITLRVDEQGMFGAFEGTLNPGGASLVGTWSQGGFSQPIEFDRATKKTEWKDPSSHSVRFATVDRGIRLEILDWGGSGPPLVLLAGLGNTAHVFDRFAPKLTASNHVYGITRRGFGASSAPQSGYSADRLGDDVLAVIDSLKIARPVLAGHSLAGEELSSIGSRFPGRVAGLIYLEAGYSYSFYNRATVLDTEEMLRSATGPSRLIVQGMQKYTSIPVPVLAIYAFPHDLRSIPDDAARKKAEGLDPIISGEQSKAFEAGVPSARVVRLPNADHYVFRSNETDVLREFNTFLQGLPRK
jgi:non-heme chloroperoxidase